MKNARKAAVEESAQKFARIVNRLRKLLIEAEDVFGPYAKFSATGPRQQEQRTEVDFNYYHWARTIARSLAPGFDSQEFARELRTSVPAETRDHFTSVRRKKLLMRLCSDGVVELIADGRGKTPAQYRVLTRRRRDRARGRQRRRSSRA